MLECIQLPFDEQIRLAEHIKRHDNAEELVSLARRFGLTAIRTLLSADYQGPQITIEILEFANNSEISDAIKQQLFDAYGDIVDANQGILDFTDDQLQRADADLRTSAKQHLYQQAAITLTKGLQADAKGIHNMLAEVTSVARDQQLLYAFMAAAKSGGQQFGIEDIKDVHMKHIPGREFQNNSQLMHAEIANIHKANAANPMYARSLGRIMLEQAKQKGFMLHQLHFGDTVIGGMWQSDLGKGHIYRGGLHIDATGRDVGLGGMLVEQVVAETLPGAIIEFTSTPATRASDWYLRLPQVVATGILY